MRRLLIALFLTLACLQLAAAGMTAGRTVVAVKVAAVDASAQNPAPCMAPASHGAVDGFAAAQPCESCTLCQACHPAALHGERMHAPAPPGSASLLAAFSARYLSADPAPGFKPPIF